MSYETLAESIVEAIESSESAPAYYNQSISLTWDVINAAARLSPDSVAFIKAASNYLNNNRTWLRISACLELPEAVAKGLKYHALYYAAQKDYVCANKDEEGWSIEKISFLAWLRAYPYGAYGGNG